MQQPDTAYLDLPNNREADALRYCLEALRWVHQAHGAAVPAWAAAVDARFLAAAEAIVDFFESAPGTSPKQAIQVVLESLATWRGDFAYDPAHPMAV
jgi:hypothetical protein